MDASGNDKLTPAMAERITLCLPNYKSGMVAHCGDDDFDKSVRQFFDPSESLANEQIIKLKTSLRVASTYDFWSILMEGMTEIVGAQYGFVAKRILADDEDSAIEMPPLGEPGSCLMGLAFYYNDGHGQVGMFRDYKYLAYGAPCAHMRHDKVFLIPERLNTFVPVNVNNFPFLTEAYLGIPLFAEGRCFAHFGLMWTEEGLQKSSLSWAFRELFLHSLEDLILERILEGQGFAKAEPDPPVRRLGRVVSNKSVTASQSLKPYARSLSHELRTPMQGVVGMLDVMHTTVEDAVEDESNDHIKGVFHSLRENIETVQGKSRIPLFILFRRLTLRTDSSKRAIEAADNVVQAYDLNMEVPDTPIASMEEVESSAQSKNSANVKGPIFPLQSNNTSIRFNGNKRLRSATPEWEFKPSSKIRALDAADSIQSPWTAGLKEAVEAREEPVSPRTHLDDIDQSTPFAIRNTPSCASDRTILPELESVTTPGLRHTQLRELLRDIINESLRVGGRPDSTVAVDSWSGESIEIRSRNSKGDASSTIIQWTIDQAVPETMLGEIYTIPSLPEIETRAKLLPVDERDLAKLISCVFLNALKFTERGRIVLSVSASPRSRFVIINIKDTGPGIPQDFIPSLFKAFTREDESLTRQKDGLGLGLLVAKGLARKIGGDVACVRSDTSGPNQGSEFEIRVPVTPLDAGSIPSTPTGNTSGRIASVPKVGLDSNGRADGSPPKARGVKDGWETSSSAAVAPALLLEAFPPAEPPVTNSSLSRRNSVSGRGSLNRPSFDRKLAEKYPLTFLVAEDNKINRSLLVTMLNKFGYKHVHEAYDGVDAVKQMEMERRPAIDVVLMDLWMPNMDGYEAAQKIMAMPKHTNNDGTKNVTMLAVTADVTSEALERAGQVGMEGLMTKPYKLLDLERLILEHCENKKQQQQQHLLQKNGEGASA